LLEEGLRIDDDAVADDAGGLRVEDAARDEVKAVLLAAGDHGVAGVVATLRADDHVDGVGEQVDDLALAFIAPLTADQNCDAHRGGKRPGPGWVEGFVAPRRGGTGVPRRGSGPRTRRAW